MPASEEIKRAGLGANRFLDDERGAIAILFALVLVPLVLAVGIAVDYARALSVKSNLQMAVDAAALAGASKETKNDVGNAGRQELAVKMLQSNMKDLHGARGLQRAVSFGQDSITVSASAVVPTTFASLIMPEISVSTVARAKFGRSGPLCLLALNGAAADTFKAWGTADLVAPDCAVQSHSKSISGMVTGGSATATATANYFCSRGGHSGTAFEPEVEDNCIPSADPYKGKFDYAKLVAGGVDVAVTCPSTKGLRVKADTTYDAGSPTSVMTFCGGMVIQAGVTVTFKPGVYKFYTQLLISSGATVIADGVTFYFGDISTGVGVADGHLEVIGGANLHLTAPTSGPLAGIAVVQPTVSTYTGGTTPALEHTIIGGGTVNIVGVIYTPQAKVRVTGNGTINETSKYFSIIADFVELEGNGQLYINAGADNTVSGLPSMPLSGGHGGYLLN